jgi:ectoine hydroxylase-related dioxygenase (phytanoyl-CoA dioxygenase family)
MPHSVRTANDCSAIRHVPMRRGSVLFFLGGAVAHGAYRWESSVPRRTTPMTQLSQPELLLD